MQNCKVALCLAKEVLYIARNAGAGLCEAQVLSGLAALQVGQPAAVQGILQEGIMPLMCLTRDTLNQKSDSIPEVALQETLGLQRLLEVLTRIQEISTD